MAVALAGPLVGANMAPLHHTASLPGFRHPPLEIQGGLGNPKPPWISSTSLEFQYYPEIQGGLGIPRISTYLLLPWNSHTPLHFAEVGEGNESAV